jgi:VWFA-related protein
MAKGIGAVTALAVAALGTALAGQQPQNPTFTTGTRTVAVFATVTNAQGRLVPDLTRDDFAVDDNGKRQPLTLFANDIQPITVVMLLDRSGSMKRNFKLEQRAAEMFVHAMVPVDKARVGTFGSRIEVQPDDFTSDRDALFKILNGDLQSDGPTPLWNAVDVGIDKLLLEQGRRVVLVFTDGVDKPMNFSNHNKSLKDVMKRAEENDVMVYAVGLEGQNGTAAADVHTGDPLGRGGLPGPLGGYRGRGLGTQPDMEKPDEGLPKIAAATGGGYFELTSLGDLLSTFDRVADELHHQYVLGFTPETLDGKMHDLAVHVLKPGLNARARKRYLASRPMRSS